MTTPVPPPEVRRLDADDWQLLRALRIEALSDSPSSFGSTLERELGFDERRWRDRLGRWPTYVADEGGDVVGLAGGVADDEGGGWEHHLVSMWVVPPRRGRGIAALLIDAVVGWAKADGATQLHLWVTAANDAARSAYARYGFVATGLVQGLPSNPSIEELKMVLELA